MKSGTNKRKILLSVSGMSPQIITETLYALATGPQPWLPDEIHLITTLQGKQNAALELLEGKKHFSQLLNEYQITQPIHFNVESIEVITNQAGEALADLRTPADNEAAADCIVHRIREFTSSPDTELHVSIAGGRKTMGFYAGYALSLFGRANDRLSHVLVSEAFESHRDFFYPAKATRVIHDRNGKPLDASQAQVWLAQIPFVRMRNLMQENALPAKASFSEIVSMIDQLAMSPDVVIEPSEGRVTVGNMAIDLPPREMGLYLLFIRRLERGQSPIKLIKSDCSQEIAEEYLSALHGIKGHDGETDSTRKALKKGMDRDYFDSLKSRLNKSLEKALGRRGAAKYQIQSGQRGSGTFFLDIEPERIRVKE